MSVALARELSVRVVILRGTGRGFLRPCHVIRGNQPREFTGKDRHSRKATADDRNEAHDDRRI
jgi:hypothetical protein